MSGRFDDDATASGKRVGESLHRLDRAVDERQVLAVRGEHPLARPPR